MGIPSTSLAKRENTIGSRNAFLKIVPYRSGITFTMMFAYNVLPRACKAVRGLDTRCRWQACTPQRRSGVVAHTVDRVDRGSAKKIVAAIERGGIGGPTALTVGRIVAAQRRRALSGVSVCTRRVRRSVAVVSAYFDVIDP